MAQVRAAYRALVKQHHPDRHAQSSEAIARSQQLNAAYEVLSDPARRRFYDQELDPTGTSDRNAPGGRIERNISQDVNLPIEDFFRGTSLMIRVNDPGNSAGAETYQLIVPAMTAPGARFRIPRAGEMEGGFVQVRLRARPGFRFKLRGSDLRCDLRISASRAAAGGSETMAGACGRSLRLSIPRNVKRGQVLRLAGEGLPKARGGRGDLLVRVIYRTEVRVTRDK
jgi:DnaJ-class molecular chaperone